MTTNAATDALKLIPSKLDRLLQRLIREAASGHGLPAVCLALSLVGTLSAAYPVTAVVVPAALLAPRRWLPLAAASALGSALGAALLVAAFHHLGWNQVYSHFPELATNESWLRTMAWVAGYGHLALFLIAASPLPQTPALLFFGMAQHDLPTIFVAMLAGKLIKYGIFAWFASRFPERFANSGWFGLSDAAERSRDAR
ncbi:MAG: hypothetical protein HZC24_11305 [Rhodocyclales bacterium]|nr:hypothetical protein [Rhodocyclales bacterium]